MKKVNLLLQFKWNGNKIFIKMEMKINIYSCWWYNECGEKQKKETEIVNDVIWKRYKRTKEQVWNRRAMRTAAGSWKQEITVVRDLPISRRHTIHSIYVIYYIYYNGRKQQWTAYLQWRPPTNVMGRVLHRTGHVSPDWQLDLIVVDDYYYYYYYSELVFFFWIYVRFLCWLCACARSRV